MSMVYVLVESATVKMGGKDQTAQKVKLCICYVLRDTYLAGNQCTPGTFSTEYLREKANLAIVYSSGIITSHNFPAICITDKICSSNIF